MSQMLQQGTAPRDMAAPAVFPLPSGAGQSGAPSWGRRPGAGSDRRPAPAVAVLALVALTSWRLLRRRGWIRFDAE